MLPPAWTSTLLLRLERKDGSSALYWARGLFDRVREPYDKLTSMLKMMLDTEEAIWQRNGAEANAHEKAKAVDLDTTSILLPQIMELLVDKYHWDAKEGYFGVPKVNWTALAADLLAIMPAIDYDFEVKYTLTHKGFVWSSPVHRQGTCGRRGAARQARAGERDGAVHVKLPRSAESTAAMCAMEASPRSARGRSGARLPAGSSRGWSALSTASKRPRRSARATRSAAAGLSLGSTLSSSEMSRTTPALLP